MPYKRRVDYKEVVTNKLDMDHLDGNDGFE